MMKKLSILAISLIIISISGVYSQVDTPEKALNSISKNVLQAQLGFLSSDWMEGRMAGDKGEAISADYIASMLRLYGVKPWGDYPDIKSTSNKNIDEYRTFFQNFIMVRRIPGDQEFKILSTTGTSKRAVVFNSGIDYTINPSRQAFEIEAPVVFAGYGFMNEKMKFNDLAGQDIKGKFILKISGVPAFVAEKMTKTEIYAARMEFENYLKSAGASGIIEFDPAKVLAGNPENTESGNISPSEDIPRPLVYQASYSLPDEKNPDEFIRMRVTRAVADEIVRNTGNDIGDYLKKADANESYNFRLMEGKFVFLRSAMKESAVAVKNILGIIEGNKKNEIIVLGAHYDHVGMNKGYIWNGADDNGSGTVGVMTIARSIMESGRKPDKTIVIALWTAEEEGLLGSEYFIRHAGVPIKDIKLNVNFDMISRYLSEDQQRKVVMTYTSSCKSFRDITDSNLKKYGIDLDVSYQPSADPPGGTDHRTFVAAGIPVMRFKPGHREEYHTPYDEVSTIDWDIMEKIVKISFANVWVLANTEW